jgi:uncharacterized membrane protein YeiH
MTAVTTIITGSNETAIVWISIIGAFAFGVSGGLAGVRARLDIFGVLVLAATVGLAGGILRDVLLGLRPASLTDWRIVVAATFAGVVAFLWRNPLTRWEVSIEAFDAVGLALFCVIGTDVALHNNATPVTAALLGTVTAVGGGAVRDIVLNRVPGVLREGLYAVPALLGSTIIVVGYEIDRVTIAWYVAAGLLCFGVRIIGMVFHVNLPVAPVPGADRQQGSDSKGAGELP